MRSKIIAVGSALVITMVALLGLRPRPLYDLSRVSPQLRALQKPYQRATGNYAVGGNIFIELVDANGRHGTFWILGGTNHYERIKYGETPFSDTVEVVDPDHTKRMLVEILEASSTNRSLDLPLLALSARPQDMVRFGYYKWKFGPF